MLLRENICTYEIERLLRGFTLALYTLYLVVSSDMVKSSFELDKYP